MSKSNINKQLIVLGNGFDLACDLKSKFTDFHDCRRNKIQKYMIKVTTNIPSFINKIKDDGLSIWHFILEIDGPKNWWNVEKCIEDFVCDCSKFKMTDLFCVVKSWNPDEDNPILTNNYKEIIFGHLKDEINLSEIKISTNLFGFLCSLYEPLPNEKVKNYLMRCLLCELKGYELDFQIYLKKQIANNKSYFSNSENLLKAITSYNIKDEKNIQTTILNFNYTHASGLKNNARQINIHGFLYHAIIFGIDAQKYLSDEFLNIFTKTYRILSDFSKISTIHYCPDVLGNKGDIFSTIKFCGHSLEIADYSYFQSLFDSCHLYDSGTKLLFFAKAMMVVITLFMKWLIKFRGC